MRRLAHSVFLILVLMSPSSLTTAAECCCNQPSCAGGPACAPACKATWDEKKSSKPKYSLKCEHACVRGFDSWHAPPPECRCNPPCGDVVVKKRLYKADGPEKVERVPKYEVRIVPAEACDCSACRAHRAADWLHPLRLLAACLPW